MAVDNLRNGGRRSPQRAPAAATIWSNAQLCYFFPPKEPPTPEGAAPTDELPGSQLRTRLHTLDLGVGHGRLELGEQRFGLAQGLSGL